VLRIFCVAAVLLWTTVFAGAQEVPTVDYQAYRGLVETDGVLIPPDRYLHPPDQDLRVEEKSSSEIRNLCLSEVTDACMADTTTHAVQAYTVARICVVGGIMQKCRDKKFNLGATISESKVLLVPRVGERFGHVVVTQGMHDALVVHEIGHLNGWPASHPRS